MEVAHHHFPFVAIGVGRGGPVCFGGTRTPGDCAQAGEEFARRECLREVIIGAHLKPDDAVRLLTTGREHENRDAAVPSDLAKDLEAVEAGEHDVEENGQPVAGSCGLNAFPPIVHRVEIVSHRSQVIAQEPAKLAVILNHQHPGKVAGVGWGRGRVHAAKVCDDGADAPRLLHRLYNFPGWRSHGFYTGGVFCSRNDGAPVARPDTGR